MPLDRSPRNVFPQTLRAVGREESGVSEIPTSATYVSVVASRQNWPVDQGQEVIRVQIFVAYDNVPTWHLLVGFGTIGGVDPRGRVISECGRHLKPEKKRQARRIKVVADTKIPLSTVIDIKYEIR